ncbi:MAG: YggS family pyridoxal phosphate-dependent enzyme [Acidobacteriota bacterium]|jgi:pyridoxal phosphate enzyme (YggS family)
MTAASRLGRVREAIEAAAREAGRDPATVRLVAIGKTFPPEAIEEVHREGQRDFGENRVQEAVTKARVLPPDIRWHLVGHLQANKAAPAAGLFSMIQSIDSLKIARRLDRLAGEVGRDLDGLVQVDLAGESTKHGAMPEELRPLLEEARSFERLRIRGLMLLPPYEPDPEDVRPWFRRIRELAADLERDGLLGGNAPVELSMGMSHDFRVAVQEGATIVRIGTAIFGAREPA